MGQMAKDVYLECVCYYFTCVFCFGKSVFIQAIEGYLSRYTHFKREGALSG